MACTATVGFPAAALHVALSARTADSDVGWDVSPSTPPIGFTPAIVLCDAASVGTMTRRWPSSTVVAVVGAHDDEGVVIAALQAGADTCIRGENVALAAAFIIAVARRGGLIPQDQPR